MHSPFIALTTHVARHALAAPDRPALVHGPLIVTYHDLNHQADQLARQLQQRGIGRDVAVGIAMNRAPAMIVAVLAVLKAGGTYVPLDPSYPAERLSWMIQDSGITLLLTQAALRDRFAPLVPALIAVDAHAPEQGGDRDERDLPIVQPHDLAYIIYTSGSTGRPKGVMIEQHSLALLADYLSTTFPLGSGARVLQFASLSFDASVWEIAMALGSGATLVLADRETLADPRALKRLLSAQRITIATLPPSLLALLDPSDLPDLQTVITAGESCPEAVARRWAVGRTFINAYGPTESTVCATLTAWAATADGSPSIGRPLPYVQAYVLDEAGGVLPVGAAGQLYLGGPALARGYRNRPDLTAERFVANPFDAQTRLYATGDRVCWREDGALDFLGRSDAQVKIRGHRVEPGEVEAVLAQHPAVRACAVVARAGQLHAYVVGDAAMSPDPAALRGYLAAQLPAWMVPAQVLLREQLPLTPNGKIDRDALRADDRQALRPDADQHAWTAMERLLAPIWERVLGVPADLDQSFFELGGDSLRAAQLVMETERVVGAAPSIAALFAAPTLGMWSAAIAQLAVVENAPEPPEPPEPPEMGTPFPLLAGQRQLLLHDRLAGPLPLYHETVTLIFRGPLTIERLRASLALLAQRHPMLRAALTAHDDQMVILPTRDVTLVVGDVTSYAVSERVAAAHHLAVAAASRPFDVANEPLWRVLYVALDEHVHHLYMTFHHLIIDGISLGILLNDLVQLYAAHQDDRTMPTEPVAVNWPALASTTHRWLASPAAATQRAYWQAQLAGANPTPLPLAHGEATGSDARGGRASLRFTAQLVEQIDAVARQEQATRFVVLATAVAALLARYSGQGDITFGTVASVRTPPTQAAVGYLLNTLPLRMTFDDGAFSFRMAVQRARQTVLGALAHRDLPFPEIAPLLRAPRSDYAQAVLPVMMTLEPALPALPVGWAASAAELDLGVSKFDLAFVFEPDTTGGLRVTASYKRSRFDAATVQRILSHLDHLLCSALGAPDESLWTLPLLPEQEQNLLLKCWQPPAPATLPPVPALVRAQAQRRPAALAVDDGRQRLTYAELDAAAARLAALLRQRGVGPGSAVAVCVPAGVNVVVACYAVLLAGGCYVPLDPTLPDERLRWMAQDSGAAVLLAETTTAARFAAALPRYLLDTDWLAAAPAPLRDAGRATPDDLAYIIYTSGSTGQPKGVAVTHANLSNLIGWHQTAFTLTAADRTTQIAGLGFDATVWEIWPTLASGATLAICDPQTRLDPVALQRWLLQQQISVAFVPTPLAEPLLDLSWPHDSALRVLLTGGDVLHTAPPPGLPFRLINNYGPTENTVVATSGEVLAHPAQQRPDIGQPIAGVRAYVLDRHQQLVPIGVPGQLYLGGSQVARGYLGRPDLSAEHFRADALDPGGRVYATGDLVCWRTDGRLDFIGRNDTQVKIRSQRIELGEIEAGLLRVAPFQAAVVVVNDQARREPVLVAYGVIKPQAGTVDATAVRAALARQLPTAMVPQELVIVAELPLTPNGKVDRAALARRPLTWEAAPVAGAGGTRTITEAQLAALWEQLLGWPAARIGGDTDFFTVGGSSLLVAQLVVAICRQFEVMFPLPLAFSEATLGRQALAIDRLRRDATAYSTVLDLEAECALPAAIVGPQTALPRGNTFQRIFLTGATGFLGAFLLRELLHTTGAIVACLVRASDAASGLARIADAYATYTGEALPDTGRVIACPGDLTAAQLGFGSAQWDTLARTVDTIIHCAANVSFVLPYEQLKAANVGGTVAVLRLSAAGGGIPVHYISTGGVFGAAPALVAQGCIHEDDPITPSKDDLYMGYLQSKWVAEQCVAQARARNLPVAIYRPGIIMGTSATGICNPDDYLPRMIIGCAQLGSYPDVLERKSIVPVDYAAGAIITIARQAASIGEVFHIVNPHGTITVTALFARLRALGCAMQEVPKQTWMAALLTAEAGANALAPLAFLFTQPVKGTQTLFDLFEHMPPFAQEHTQAALRGSDLRCEPVSDALLHAWLGWFVAQGLLEAQGSLVG